MESSTVQDLIQISSSLSLNRRSLQSANIGSLIEYSNIPESSKVEEAIPPIISPYNIYRKRGSFPSGIKSIRQLLKSTTPRMKEYVQASEISQCDIPYSINEQYVTLNIMPEMITQWKAEGYSHLHLGAVRLVLSFQGRKGLPISAKVALLDSRFTDYEHALIGTVVTTLNCGSVVLTLFPNYAVSLNDPNLSTALKVQLQVTDTHQVTSAIMATLHHQLVYRLQNHALDLQKSGSSNALMVLADADNEVSSVVEIPRQIKKEELQKLIPTQWISNFENLQKRSELVQATASSFSRLADGRIKTTFQIPEEDAPQTSTSQFMMQPINHKEVKWQEKVPAYSFRPSGHVVSTDRINGHFIWDIPGSGMCDSDCSCDDNSDYEDDNPRSRRARKQRAKKRCALKIVYPDDSDSEEDRQPPQKVISKTSSISDKYESLPPCKIPSPYSLLNIPTPCNQYKTPVQSVAPPIPCMMFSYSSDFPPLERKIDERNKITSSPFVHHKGVDDRGRSIPLSQSEEVLN